MMGIFNRDQSVGPFSPISGVRYFLGSSRTLIQNDPASQAAQVLLNPDAVDPHMIKDRDIYVIDKRSGRLHQQVYTVAPSCQSMVSLYDFNDAVILTLQNVTSKTVFVLNIDTFHYLTDAVDKLLALRPMLPDAVVIICSTKFADNDFSNERKAIADASLRLPCDQAALKQAIATGITNQAGR